MRVAPFLLTMAILIGGVVLAFFTITGSPDDSAPVAERPTVTPRPRPTSPSQLAQGAPTQVPSLGFSESGAAAPPLSAPQPPTASPTVVPTASPTVVPTVGGTATPAPTPSAVPPTPSPTGDRTSPTAGQLLRVGNTDGQGVYLRRTPRMDDKVRAWMDGTAMVVVGPPVTGDGHTWQHVRAPDGTEGYIPAEYLVGG